ncbi:MAG: hypothetical protein AVDCRST_MAG49-1759 [uncultured Thermomicrobiales bacterium]|uniref:Uncharacterized protein n=1 Tax=uncultured Thermomicrobiales bacterium TaxID=1645740 RepID=A0A6J4UH13_9BACT|nr:MAG: hypothetical protein AVDCRST_MAG49-1759 [uncultured Thermomicrobiales bacterium]
MPSASVPGGLRGVRIPRLARRRVARRCGAAADRAPSNAFMTAVPRILTRL